MQTEIINLNDLVKKEHPYRKLLSIIDFQGLVIRQRCQISTLDTKANSKGVKSLLSTLDIKFI